MCQTDGIELQEFIKSSIIGIDNAMKEASDETGEDYLFTNGSKVDEKGNIHFELTVYSSTKGDGSIRVAGSNLGIRFGLGKERTATSKINFTICRKKR